MLRQMMKDSPSPRPYWSMVSPNHICSMAPAVRAIMVPVTKPDSLTACGRSFIATDAPCARRTGILLDNNIPTISILAKPVGVDVLKPANHVIKLEISKIHIISAQLGQP